MGFSDSYRSARGNKIIPCTEAEEGSRYLRVSGFVDECKALLRIPKGSNYQNNKL